MVRENSPSSAATEDNGSGYLVHGLACKDFHSTLVNPLVVIVFGFVFVRTLHRTGCRPFLLGGHRFYGKNCAHHWRRTGRFGSGVAVGAPGCRGGALRNASAAHDRGPRDGELWRTGVQQFVAFRFAIGAGWSTESRDAPIRLAGDSRRRSEPRAGGFGLGGGSRSVRPRFDGGGGSVAAANNYSPRSQNHS